MPLDLPKTQHVQSATTLRLRTAMPSSFVTDATWQSIKVSVCETPNSVAITKNSTHFLECYGVPYIPEGQWLCRKCQLSPEHPVVSYKYPSIMIRVKLPIELYSLPNRRWRVQTDKHRLMGPPPLCDVHRRN